MTPEEIRRAIGHATAADLAEGLNAALDYMSGVGHSAPVQIDPTKLARAALNAAQSGGGQ